MTANPSRTCEIAVVRRPVSRITTELPTLQPLGGSSSTPRPFQGVNGAAHTPAAGTTHDVCVDHGRVDAAVPQQLLDRPNVIAVLDEMRGERMSEGVAVDVAFHSSGARGLRHGPLNDSLVQVMATNEVGTRIGRQIFGREEPLPAPPEL
jgi:hypothetical protein